MNLGWLFLFANLPWLELASNLLLVYLHLISHFDSPVLLGLVRTTIQ